MQHSFKAIVFDLDGTLVDSLGDFHLATTLMLEKLGYGAIDREIVQSFIGNGQEVLVARCLVHVGSALSASELAEASRLFTSSYDGILGQRSHLYPGVIAALESAKAYGLKVGLCTNRANVRALQILRHFGIHRLFNAVIGIDNCSAPKPDPAPLNACSEGLGVAPQDMLYVGDSEVDAMAADSFGCAFAYHQNGFGTLRDQDRACELYFESFGQFNGLVFGIAEEA